LFVVVGGVAACSGAVCCGAACCVVACGWVLESSSPEVVDGVVVTVALLELDAGAAAVNAVAAPGKVMAMATAPRALAVPAPKVMADTQASPLLRASCRAEPEVGELVMLLRSRVEGALGVLGCSWFMAKPSSARLYGLWVLPLNCL
jgi:hypothetical protein